ncbi:MAG TPA: hypothetical protein VF442_09530, partial [Sphingobium sp.]
MPPHSRSRLAGVAFLAVLATSGLALSACDRGVSAAISGSAASLNPAQVNLLLATLDQAPTHGFQPGAFGELGLAERLKEPDSAARAQLRLAVLAYARALHGQAIPRRDFDPKWGVRPPPYDAETEFRHAARRGELIAWVKSLAPTSPQYRDLRAGYAAYGRIRALGGWAPLPTTEDLSIGARGPQVTALRERLAVEDPAAAEAPAGDVYDVALAQAVQRAQQRYGLHPT